MVLLYDCTVLASLVCVRLDVIEARQPEIADPPVRWGTERGVNGIDYTVTSDTTNH